MCGNNSGIREVGHSPLPHCSRTNLGPCPQTLLISCVMCVWLCQTTFTLLGSHWNARFGWQHNFQSIKNEIAKRHALFLVKISIGAVICFCCTGRTGSDDTAYRWSKWWMKIFLHAEICNVCHFVFLFLKASVNRMCVLIKDTNWTAWTTNRLASPFNTLYHPLPTTRGEESVWNTAIDSVVLALPEVGGGN